MLKIFARIAIAGLLIIIGQASVEAAESENMLLLELKDGTVVN